MLTDHRHEEILSQLAQTGRVGVTSIAATLAFLTLCLSLVAYIFRTGYRLKS